MGCKNGTTRSGLLGRRTSILIRSGLGLFYEINMFYKRIRVHIDFISLYSGYRFCSFTFEVNSVDLLNVIFVWVEVGDEIGLILGEVDRGSGLALWFEKDLWEVFGQMIERKDVLEIRPKCCEVLILVLTHYESFPSHHLSNLNIHRQKSVDCGCRS